MDKDETINHYPAPASQRRRAAGNGKDDYRALLDSTEQEQQYEFVKKTPFGEVSSCSRSAFLPACCCVSICRMSRMSD